MNIVHQLFLNPSATVAVTNWLAALIFIGLGFLALALRDRNNAAIPSPALNLLILVIGALAGWALAMFWVPFDESEKKIFSQIGATVTAFISGYAVSKFDKVIDAVLLDDKRRGPLTLPRLGLFLAAFFLSAVVVVTNRADWISRQDLSVVVTVAEATYETEDQSLPDKESLAKWLESRKAKQVTLSLVKGATPGRVNEAMQAALGIGATVRVLGAISPAGVKGASEIHPKAL